MLVRDEAPIIKRCLDSVKPLITSFCIIDTGSIDDTIDVINKELYGLSGEIISLPFSNFANLRTQLYYLAGKLADYVLCLDADEELNIESGFSLITDNCPEISLVEVGPDDYSYFQPRLIKSGLNISVSGVLPESLKTLSCYSTETLSNCRIMHHEDGFRHQSMTKTELDLITLLADLNLNGESDEINLKLGIVALQAKDYSVATSYFDKAIQISTNIKILWQAYYFKGIALNKMNDTIQENAIQSFLHAYELYPDRVEPLYHLICMQQKLGNIDIANSLIDIASEISLPTNVDYLERRLYKNKFEDLHSDYF